MLTFINNHETLFFWLTFIGVLGFIGSLVVIPWILIKIPHDYFRAEKRQKRLSEHCPKVVWWIVIVIKNIVGFVLILSGIVMLFTPGQGVLTIIGGIVLMDFPHKYRLIRGIIKNTKILKLINALRAKANREPLSV